MYDDSFTLALKKNNIEFISKKNGSPHMGKSKNKLLYLEFLSGKFDEKEECIICMNNTINQSYVITPCKHKFCVECYSKHIRMKSDCPICRTILCKTESIYSMKDLIPIITEDIINRNINIDMPLNIFNWYSWFRGYYQNKIKMRLIVICIHVLNSIVSLN